MASNRAGISNGTTTEEQTQKSGLDAVIGHTSVITTLRRLLTEDRLPGALLLTGPEGVGKRTTALRLAEEALGRSLGAVLNETEGHYAEDLIYYRCGAIRSSQITLHGTKMAGGVDFIRSRVLENLSLTLGGGQRRFVILTAFDEMNHVVWETMLKTLEEPPPSTTLILTTARRGLLPVTILSRCHEMVFTRLGGEDCGRVLRRVTDWDKSEIAEWSALADGSPGRALTLSQTGLKDQLAAARDFLDGKTAAPFELTRSFKRDRAGAAELAMALARQIRRQALARNASENEMQRTVTGVQTLLEAADDLLDAGINPDGQLVMDDTLIRLRRCLS